MHKTSFFLIPVYGVDGPPKCGNFFEIVFSFKFHYFVYLALLNLKVHMYIIYCTIFTHKNVT